MEETKHKAWKIRGAAFAGRGDHVNAVSAFRNALRREPRDAETWLALARVHEAAGQRVEAVRAYGAARRIWKRGTVREQEEAALLHEPIERLREAIRFAYREMGYSHLDMAVMRDDQAALEEWLGKGEKINDKNYFGETPVLNAARGGKAAMVRFLLSRGADPKIPDSIGRTTLMKAAGAGSVETVKILLSAGVDVRSRDTAGHSALWEAVFSAESVPVTAILIEAGADLTERYPSDQSTPLLLACHYDRRAIIDLLLRRGCGVNEKDNQAFTPLHLAAYHDDFPLCKRLIGAGAQLNACTTWGYTPLMAAAEHAALNLIEFLLTSGCDVHLKTKYDDTAWSYASRRTGENDPEGRASNPICDLLEKYGAGES